MSTIAEVVADETKSENEFNSRVRMKLLRIARVQELRKECREAIKFIDLGRLSGEVMRPSRDPFQITIEPKADKTFKIVNSKYLEEMPIFLRHIYLMIGNKSRELQTESGWMILSLDYFEKSAANHEEKGQNKMRLFAHRYDILGWYFKAYYVVETKQTFITPGGGSNGFDSYQNRINGMHYNPGNLKENETHDIKELLNMEHETAEESLVKLPDIPYTIEEKEEKEEKEDEEEEEKEDEEEEEKEH
jgi:hypothetical protein